MDINGMGTYYQDLVSTSSATTQAQTLKNQVENSDLTKATDEELLNVCKQFEAYFLEQVYKGMEKTIPKSELNSDASTSSLVDYFKGTTIQQIAEESTENNSLGIAQMLYEQMKRNYSLE